MQFIAPVFALMVMLVVSTALGQAQRGGESDAPPPALNAPVIKVAQGKVQGSVADGVAIYRGLPFAAPPLGELRWREPRPPAKWSHVRAANVFSSTCVEAEDCLYLNVYKPGAAKGGDRLPVMVWIHGGAFIFGSGSMYDGTQFAKRGVVLVTINYRLGRAGWFAHPALTHANQGLLGNYGMMDQIAALAWVRDNIREFGGDPKNVTIFGESAGAISVNYLMLAPQAQGLFAKALSESGFGRLQAKPLAEVEKMGDGFAANAGVRGGDATAAAGLRALSWQDLGANVGSIGAAQQILPMADGKLITGSAAQGFAAGNEARVPYLLGGNSDEASLTRRGLNAQERFLSVQDRRDVFLAVYDPDHTNDVERIVARMITDFGSSEPDRDLARLHASHGNPTFVYHFSYTPAAQRAHWFGMPHGGELAYVFDTPFKGQTFDTEGLAVADAANKYWAEFARTGDPAAAGGVRWPAFENTDEWLMEFPDSGVPAPSRHFHKDRLDWIESGLAN